MDGQSLFIAAIWATALLVWLLFRLFYDGLRRPLSAAEIDAFLATLPADADAMGNDRARLRAFLEADDGREFVMLNLVGVRHGPVTDPATGETCDGAQWLRRYSQPFVRALVRRGGHPLFVGGKVGGYIDAWNTPADPGWSLFGTMRYRSRRDFVRLASDPAFRAAHPAKRLAIATTFSFPAQRQLGFHASPRTVAALLCALLAALGHIAILTWG